MGHCDIKAAGEISAVARVRAAEAAHVASGAIGVATAAATGLLASSSSSLHAVVMTGPLPPGVVVGHWRLAPWDDNPLQRDSDGVDPVTQWTQGKRPNGVGH